MIPSRCNGNLFHVLALLLAFCSGGLIAGFQDPATSRGLAENQNADSDRKEILETLTRQAAWWNAGDIEGFMQTYWKSEEMTFSSGGTTHVGWQAALDRYKKNYPVEKMGRLTFENGPLTMLADDAALLLGNFSLERDGKTSGGNFSLVLKKFPEGWRIIHDHSSSLEKAEPAGEKGDSTVATPSGNNDKNGNQARSGGV